MENTKQTPQEKSTLSNILEQIKIVLVIYGIVIIIHVCQVKVGDTVVKVFLLPQPRLSVVQRSICSLGKPTILIIVFKLYHQDMKVNP